MTSMIRRHSGKVQQIEEGVNQRQIQVEFKKPYVQLDRHTLATVFTYLTTKERIRVGQVCREWYERTIDPIAWSADTYVLHYFKDLCPTDLFPPRYRPLVRCLCVDPDGSVHLHHELENMAESATTLLQEYTGITEITFDASIGTERVITTFCQSYLELDQQQRMDRTNPLGAISTPKHTQRLFKRVVLELPRDYLLPVLLESPRMRHLEILECTFEETSPIHIESLVLLQKLQHLSFRANRKKPAGSIFWTTIQQLPLLHTLSVQSVSLSKNTVLPSTLKTVNLSLVEFETFDQDIFSTLDTSPPPHLRHVSVRLPPLVDRDLANPNIVRRESFLQRLARLTTLQTVTIDIQQPSFPGDKGTVERGGWALREFIRCNRSSLRVESMVMEADIISNCKFRRSSAAAASSPAVGEGTPAGDFNPFESTLSSPPTTPTNIDAPRKLPPQLILVLPFLTGSLTSLDLHRLTFDHTLIQALNDLPTVATLRSLHLYPLWVNRIMTGSDFLGVCRAIGRQTELHHLSVQFSDYDVFQPWLNDEPLDMEALLMCHKLTSITWLARSEFLRHPTFTILGRLPHLVIARIQYFSSDRAFLPLLLTSPSLQHLQISFGLTMWEKCSIDREIAFARLVRLLRPHSTRLITCEIDGKSMAYYSSVTDTSEQPPPPSTTKESKKSRRCTIQ